MRFHAAVSRNLGFLACSEALRCRTTQRRCFRPRFGSALVGSGGALRRLDVAGRTDEGSVREPNRCSDFGGSVPGGLGRRLAGEALFWVGDVVVRISRRVVDAGGLVALDGGVRRGIIFGNRGHGTTAGARARRGGRRRTRRRGSRRRWLGRGPSTVRTFASLAVPVRVQAVGVGRVVVEGFLGLQLAGVVRAVQVPARWDRGRVRLGRRLDNAPRRALADAVAPVRELALLHYCIKRGINTGGR